MPTRVTDLRLPLWLALVVAAGSGVVLDAGFPDGDVWPLAFVGIGLVLVSLRGRRAGSAFLVGLVAGLSFYLVHISWTSLYLGALPWAALSTLEALFFAGGAVLVTLAYRWVPRIWPGAVGTTVLLPVVVAGLWTLREFVAGNWPYGGFAWGRVALSQSQSPFGPLVAWVGISGLSFLMVALVAAVLELALRADVRASTRVLAGAVAVTAVLAVPAWPTTSSGTATIAGVQGNGPAGYFDEREPGDLLNSQVLAMSGLPAGSDLDLIVWPEGGSDRDPTRDAYGRYVFDAVSDGYDAPLLSGVITQSDDGEEAWNSSILWEDGAVAGQYDKKHPVPFGEYVPDRSFWRPFAPDLIDLIARDYTPGTRPEAMPIGDFVAGISICFDIVDDQLITNMMRDGAQVIVAQTNNADFGDTDENAQQLAITRLRALETARPVVSVSTVASSRVIDADGQIVAGVTDFTAGTMVHTVDLGTGTTPAVVASRAVELFVSFLGLAALVLARVMIGGRRSRRRRALETAAWPELADPRLRPGRRPRSLDEELDDPSQFDLPARR
ncbi:apolipoprotein N-acyltransferase [Frigoribacterium sp. PvP120]|uniref:apolipoprotein N-acyltransferase n=1 Tax=unclassified Frigoribacterium TaxID=2627005 RepID=UPI001B632A92|nr:apolipoprotein N-acyltransferase [Frigoribacterium sp. PvP121]MBP1241965.1 apolipoprotein N-acyltransferase [Frigoribacterium sp. PvP121]